jgi:hypothetical protein
MANKNPTSPPNFDTAERYHSKWLRNLKNAPFGPLPNTEAWAGNQLLLCDNENHRCLIFDGI